MVVLSLNWTRYSAKIRGIIISTINKFRDVFIHKYLEPVYETHKGWKEDISQIKDYEKLPENCKRYISRLEELLEVPISIVSVGPDREQTIFRKF